ncbi:MAG: DUF1573 domain-containing protein [Planctomycetaceae bacterium]|jgi:hypothetical protein|nr:DUF1573 domain-containing protein [Planctomycetaceae bacterium]
MINFHKIFLLSIVTLFLIVGCKDSDLSTKTISISPTTLDFGKARHGDSPVKLSFRIANNSTEPLNILNIHSGCGCTVVNVPTEPILPHKSVICQVKVDILGRKGNFFNQLCIESQNQPNLFVDILGEIVADVWFDEQSLRTTASKGQDKLSVRFNLYTTNHPDAIFMLDHSEKIFSISELSRKKNNDGTTVITFNLDVFVGDEDFISKPLKIISSSNSIAPIVIPFFYYRDEEPNTSPVLKTTRISFGVLYPKETKIIQIYGDSDIISAICDVDIEEVPNGITVEKTIEDKKDLIDGRLSLKIQIDATVLQGVFEGKVFLTTYGNRKYVVPINGEIRNQSE